MSSSDALRYSSGSQSERNFAVQYTSLILIILTFITGAFVRDRLQIEQSEQQAQQTQELLVEGPDQTLLSGRTFLPVEPSEFGTFNYRSLFSANGELDLNKANAFLMILENHDVRADFKFFPITQKGKLNKGVSDTQLAQVLAASISLQKHFRDSGLPPEAFQISVVESARENGVEVKVRHIDEQSQRDAL